MRFPTPKHDETEADFIERSQRLPAVLRKYSRQERETAARKHWRENGKLPESESGTGPVETMDFRH